MNNLARFWKFLLCASCFSVLGAAPNLYRKGPFWGGSLPIEAPKQNITWHIQNAFPKADFVDPVGIAETPNPDGRFFIVEKIGRVFTIERGDPNAQQKLVLDISNRVQVGEDSGMIAFAFHPEFGKRESRFSHLLYVTYQYSPKPVGGFLGSHAGTPSYFRLSSFQMDEAYQKILPDSEVVLIQQFDRNLWHNGGALFFDEKQFLYLTVGDEGAAYDHFNNSQRLNRYLFGGVLRIDVNEDFTQSHPIRRQPEDTPERPENWPKSFTAHYLIPNDNPWQDPLGNVLEEFFALGFRSPYSMSYDQKKKTIWLGDVGQGAREEINLIEKGGNYQWPYQEGDLLGPKLKPEILIGEDKPPVYAYGREAGAAVISGPVYRGGLYSGYLDGKLLFGDHVSRRIWTLPVETSEELKPEYLFSLERQGPKVGLSSFYVSSQGEIFLTEVNGTGRPGGRVYVVRGGAPIAEAPRHLSDLRLFKDLSTLEPEEGLEPYEINVPFWSDGAEKKRWVAFPSGNPKLIFQETGPWEFPEGSVFVKHFSLGNQKVETRILVRDAYLGVYGLSYQWLADQSDAILLKGAAEEKIHWKDTAGKSHEQTWHFPSRESCTTCHNSASHGVLGVNTHQINHARLREWNQKQLFDPPIEDAKINHFLQGASFENTHATMEHRVRSYLDSNCAFCHRPDGVLSSFDARLSTPLIQQNLINGTALKNGEKLRIVKPGDANHSLLLTRINALGDTAMPPLAKQRIDQKAVENIRLWIESLNPSNYPEGKARFIQFEAVSEVNEGPWASAAEIEFYDKDLGKVPIEEIRIVSTNSEEEGTPAKFAIDGDLKTIWHTEWVKGTPHPPHQITFDLGKSYLLGALKYTGRQDGGSNGMVKNYRVLGRNSLEEPWQEISLGSFEKTTGTQTAVLRIP